MTRGFDRQAPRIEPIFPSLQRSAEQIYVLRATEDTAAVGTTFNVFSYDAVLTENWTYHLPNAEQKRYATDVGFKYE